MMRSILFVALATLSVTACSKKEGEGGAAAKSAEGGGGASANNKPAGPTKLAKLGLEINAPGPGETMIQDGIGGEGLFLNNVSFGAISIDVLKQEPYPTPETAKSDAEMFNPKDFKSETLPDGFYVTFNNTGSMGANYFVEVHRKIGDKQIKCATASPEQKLANAALEACKTIKAG